MYSQMTQAVQLHNERPVAMESQVDVRGSVWVTYRAIGLVANIQERPINRSVLRVFPWATTAKWHSPVLLRPRRLWSLRHCELCQINLGREQNMSKLKGFYFSNLPFLAHQLKMALLFETSQRAFRL